MIDGGSAPGVNPNYDSTGPKDGGQAFTNGDRTSFEQTPGGKRIFDAGGSLPPGSKIHQTGSSLFKDYGDGSFMFGTRSGGELSGISSSPRSEGKIKMEGGTKGHTFSADYQINNPKETTFFQMKSGNGGSPNVRISMDENGNVFFHNRDGSPEKIAQLKPGEKFTLNVTHNDDNTVDVTIVGEDGVEQTTEGHTISMDDGPPVDFRFGVYEGEPDEMGTTAAIGNIQLDGMPAV